MPQPAATGGLPVSARKILVNTRVKAGEAFNYINQTLARRHVTRRPDAARRAFAIEHVGTLVKQLPIKSLVGERTPFDAFLAMLCEEARSEQLPRARGS